MHEVKTACEEYLTEFFDKLDCRGVKTDAVISRDEAHRTGVWHGAFHCLIIGERNGQGYALFQKRSMAKKIAPGKFDVSVGGHYAAGEDAAIAGPREIKEEIGLVIRPEDLVSLGRRVFVYCFTPGTTEYEFQDVFLLYRTMDLNELALQREELDGVVEMNVDEGIALFSGRQAKIDAVILRADGPTERLPVSAVDFVPCLDNYYLKLLLLAKRYINGERELLLI